MTALAGFLALDGRDPLAPCRRMLKAQAMYGRGGADWTDGVMALGRELFPTLPEDRFDKGPARGAGGRLALAADVRIDNRGELEAALGIDREAAGETSDAALLLAAFERWDMEDALERVVGDFAFALWDAEAGRLTLGRDHAGQRPLHVHRGAGFLAFASMPKGLHALPEIPYALDRQAALDWLALMPADGRRTLFEGVERVEPGTILVVGRDGAVAARPWWRPSLEPLLLPSAADYQAAMRERLDAATEARLRGGGAMVGAHLSAGLDSAAVAATAARLLAPAGGRVVAFTAVPREGYDGPFVANTIGDEGPLAALTAAMHPNIEHVRISTEGISPLDALDRNFLAHDAPMLNLCNGTWGAAIDEAAKARGLSVMLIGAMGNMSFSYAGMEHLPELLGRGRLVRLARAALGLHRGGMRAGTIAAQTLGPYLPRPLWRAIARLRGSVAGLAGYSLARADEAALKERAAARGLDLAYRPRRDPAETRLWVLRRVDRGTYNKGQLAAHGVDHRDPTADRRLMEYCLRVPMEQYLRGGRARALARDGLADRLPAAVLDEKLKGLQASDWHEGLTADRARLREEAERLARSPHAAGLVDTDRLLRLIDDWPQGGWASKRVVQSYRLALLRGISAGHFIRRVTGSN
ncbi:MAG: asparagine synthetase B family protein [Allosphingosinicella sp.]